MAAQTQDESSAGLGILIVGLGGAVASTMAAGIERIRCGAVDRTGLPLAAFDKAGLASYETLQIGGWDLNPDDLATALAGHRVLSRDDAAGISDALSRITPWPAVGNTAFCRNVDGRHRFTANSLLGAVEQLRINMRQFRERTGVQRLVVINLASVESWPADTQAFASLATFETALADNDPSVSPAMLYAYAAIAENVPYGNFTPSLGADIPALVEFAEQRGVPLAGKDGKTGQTFIKTVIAPALRDRNLHVDGWFSTNILGNRDGQALEDPGSLSSKLSTKGGVIDDILGYKVEDHLVHIHYYRPRGDDKEAWDNIDVTGFLGQRMQLKINFLCKDSVLAAPLAIEIARCLDLAHRRGEGGIQPQLGVFFKSPMVDRGERPDHDFSRQQRRLVQWLDAGR